MGRDDDATIREASLAFVDTRPAGLPDRYRLGDVIGVGGMGCVYRAHDTVLGRDVAIKVLELHHGGSSATRPRERFVREARAAARLVHPSIVAIHDVDADAGWLVMDLVEGESLRELADGRAMNPTIVRGLAMQILGALDVAHASGVIHRDIKPSNVMVDRFGKVTLVDFGVARLVDAEVTKTGESLGTPAYMAPEQLRGGAVDARTDLYGLAATLYELVTAERMIAFETPDAQALARVRAECRTEPGLGELVVACLQASPDARPDSARRALALLTTPPRRSRKPFVIAGVLALVVGAIVFALLRRAPTDSSSRRAELFALAQRGEHEKAGTLLEHYVRAHPEDTEARAMLLLNIWWETGRLVDPFSDANKLSPVHRDMLHGLAMLASRNEAGAIAFLQQAQRQYPDSVEIEYALGEAYWHAQQLEHGAELLARAFERDPRWQMALHHVVEFRLSRRDTAQLATIAERLRAIDPPRAAALACQLAIAKGDFAAATSGAQAALATLEPVPDLHTCLAHAQILANDVAAAATTLAHVTAAYPVDLREWGATAIGTELQLYRGDFDAYLANVRGTERRQKVIALALWRPDATLVEDPQTADSVRGQPIVPASQTLVAHVHGFDAKDVYDAAPELELRAYGRGLAAERAQDLPAAIAHYRHALALPQKGDIRMLVAYQLAHALHAAGDDTGAATACRDVIEPALYMPYRAVLLPDCVLWSGDPARWRQLAATWTGSFEHPSVVEVRRRLRAATE